MTSFRTTRVALVIVAIVASVPLAAASKAKPNVVILATGGTIAGAAATGTQAGYTSGAVNIDTMIAAVPGIKDLANIKGEQISNVGSQDMSFDILLKLAKRINELAASPGVDGIVVTHGTDTMEESAFFLNLTVKTDKPVVMVGSMRPATAVSADGPGNLYNAVATATNAGARGRGVLVELNDEIHYARNVQKTNTSSVQTFSSVNRGPAGLVNTGKISWFQPMDKKHGTSSGFSVDGLTKLPRVDILYAYPNMSVDLIDAAIKDGAQGLVIAGVGDGNMTKPALDRLAEAAKSGVVVVRSSRVGSGIVYRNNEVDDDKMGFVASGELSPGKSRVLLQLALTKTKDPRQIQQYFNEY